MSVRADGLALDLMDRQVRAEVDPFYPRFWREKLEIFNPFEHMIRHQASKGIFVCDMGDLFGQGVPESWTGEILSAIHRMKQHRFYLLTKQPQQLPQWSPFPDNAWVGVTATNQESYYDGVSNIAKVEAKVKFVSFEPLLEQINGGECAEEYRLDSIDEFDWLVIGACTGSSWEMVHLGEKYNRDLTEPSAMTRLDTKWALQPRIEWVREIVEAADKAGVKVFLKDNLGPLGLPLDSLYYSQYETENGPEYRLRQEMPE
jgi:hypothetical protein